jgi:hypothetical protein
MKILIQQAVTKYDLDLKYFNEHTLHSRVMKKNPSSIAKHKVTPLSPIEPEIVKVVCQMGKVCNAMTKRDIMDLADDIIRGTIYAQRYTDHCALPRIVKTMEGRIVGEKWYLGFHQRWAAVLNRGRVCIQDEKRRTWCVERISIICMKMFMKTW